MHITRNSRLTSTAMALIFRGFFCFSTQHSSERSEPSAPNSQRPAMQSPIR